MIPVPEQFQELMSHGTSLEQLQRPHDRETGVCRHHGGRIDALSPPSTTGYHSTMMFEKMSRGRRRGARRIVPRESSVSDINFFPVLEILEFAGIAEAFGSRPGW